MKQRSWHLYLSLVVLVLAAMVALDVPMATWVRGSHFPAWFKLILTLVRQPGIYWFTLALAAVGVVWLRWAWHESAALLLAGAFASGVTALLKICCGRIRPFRGEEALHWLPFRHNLDGTLITQNLSFPSGDATLAFATAAVFTYLMPRWKHSAYAWAIAVAVTRVLEGAHYPSDTIAASIVGLMTANGIVRLLRCTETTDLMLSTAEQPTLARAA